MRTPAIIAAHQCADATAALLLHADEGHLSIAAGLAAWQPIPAHPEPVEGPAWQPAPKAEAA